MPRAVASAEVLRTLQKVPEPHKVFPRIDSPYSKYTNSNYAALGWEFPVIRDIISQQNDQIKDLDTIIERAENIVNQFREMREQIASSVRAHEGFLSCIRRLPVEILKEIFMQCLPPKLAEPAAETSPLLLTQLCRDWRAVALDTPRLWSSLCITGVTKLSFYHDWLEKAKGLPISLLVWFGRRNAASQNAISKFFQLHTRRLANLSVQLGTNDDLRVLLKDIPLLERLCLTGTMEILKGGQAISITQPQPRLHTLIINAPTLDNEILSLFNPRWENLTRLAIMLGFIEMEADRTFFAILQMCPNLEHFVFSGPVLNFEDEDPISFTHSKLRLLEVANYGCGGSLSDRLLLPNLCSLQIHCNARTSFMHEPLVFEKQPRRILHISIDTYVSEEEYEILSEVIDPGWTDLTHLTVDGNISDIIFLNFLQFSPNLEDVVISELEIDEDFPIPPVPLTHLVLHSLRIRNLEGPLQNLLGLLTLPRLCHLDISLPDNPEWLHAQFTEFLSRSQCPLVMLKIKGVDISIEEKQEIVSLMPTLIHVEMCETADAKENLTEVPVFSWTGY